MSKKNKRVKDYTGKEFVITREINAPRELVFRAWTNAKELMNWWGPRGFTNPVCNWDPRPGNAIHVVMRGPNGVDYPMGGEFREIVVPERLVFTSGALDENKNLFFEFLHTVLFVEKNGKTTLTIRSRVLKSRGEANKYIGGFETGMTQSLERLASHLAKSSATGTKVILKMSISVDGFVGGPNGEIDWIFPGLDDGAKAWIIDTLWHTSVHIMGSRTYQDMAAYWPTSTEPFAAPMNEIPKVIFSSKQFVKPNAGLTTTTLKNARNKTASAAMSSSAISAQKASWANPNVANGELAREIARLKQQYHTGILAHGGARFAQSLVKLDLVDEYRLLVHPVVLGRGLPLFLSPLNRIQLKLLGSTAFNAGTVAQIYERVSSGNNQKREK